MVLVLLMERPTQRKLLRLPFVLLEIVLGHNCEFKTYNAYFKPSIINYCTDNLTSSSLQRTDDEKVDVYFGLLMLDVA